jgi:hypothetical protein
MEIRVQTSQMIQALLGTRVGIVQDIRIVRLVLIGPRPAVDTQRDTSGDNRDLHLAPMAYSSSPLKRTAA